MSSVVMEVLKKVQITKASYQKQLKILKQEYDRGSVEHFFVHIRNFLKFIFKSNTNVYVEKVLEFLAHFISEVTPDDTMEDDFTETGLHPLLTMTIKETLKYHRLVNECLRCNSCLFIRLILAQIGPNKNLDNEICDLIEEAMLERTLDPKPAVRYQAVLALIRLQDPMNADSPVNKAYLSLIVDANALIRAEVVKNIAPYNISIPQIVNRLRDIDPNVRIAAVRKCADLSPKSFKILERQHILTCGITEDNPKVKNVFIENLLPKWLNTYQNNYILFLNALKLDADENDISNTEKITKDLFELWLRSTPVTQIISVLPLDEETKVISLNKLTSEAVAVWYNLVMYLRDNGSKEEYLDDILPDLTPFCNYVESIINEKSKHKMEDWEYLDYQYILNSLFGIAAGYDLADEVGRKTLHQLTLKLLREENLLLNLKKKLVTLSAQSAQKTEDITNVMCHVISDIQAPLIEVQVEQNPVEQTNKECQKAEIKIKIIRLEAELEDAAENQEYLKAETLKNSISELKRQLQELATSTIEMVKVTKDDHKTVCECLDLLISLLALPHVTTMTPSLVAVKEEFVIPLLSRDDIDDEINWRLLKCIAMFCILDESMAQEYVKKLCIPFITYRQIPNYNKQALMISIKAITDIFRVYGYNIFGSKDSTMVSSNGNRSNLSLTTSFNKRRLYGIDQSDDSVILVHNWETIVEVILNMLDDEISEIRNVAIEAISKLILNEFPVSATVISRLILKWYNPMAAQVPDKSQQLIGVVLSNYVRKIEGAKEVIANAIIPTLQSIVSAPATSPLAAVDVDNLLLFLSNIIDADNRKDLINIHINMAHMFTHEIIKKRNDFVAIYLSKLLLYLDISTDNAAAIKELKTQVQKVLDDESLSEKTLKRNLLKFHEKLNVSLEKLNSIAEANLETTEVSNGINSSEDNSQNEACDQITSSESQQLSHVTNSTRHNTNLSSIQEVNEDDENEEAFDNDVPNTDGVDKTKSTDDEEVVEPDKNLTNNSAGSEKEGDKKKKNTEEQNSEERSSVESSNDRNKNSKQDDENHVITPKSISQEKRKRTKDAIEDTNSDTDNNNKFSKRRKKERSEGNTHSGTGDKGTPDLSEDEQEHLDKSKNQDIVVNITPNSRISTHMLQIRRNLRNNKSSLFIQSSSSNENNREINKPRKRNASQKASKTNNVEVSSGPMNQRVIVRAVSYSSFTHNEYRYTFVAGEIP
ncbi:condensin complex subunit 3-like isoform X2 [Diabrotica undecimpunctata]|uniref:condensin complex subunit 3-like isoform X2 n=1 Tax=Diabrotica undecimpunctata TaxID=50387 RepID=UPI003B63EF9F